MEQISSYVILFSIIVGIAYLFRRSEMPIGLILVVTGIILSFLPFFPKIELNSQLVLDVFLPLLVYQISAFSSWRDVKNNVRPIAFLSIGHVIFITILVASAIHYLIPELSWALAIMLGAIISPPDDVAFVAIAEKLRIPDRLLIILEGEGLFNDAAALIIFRMSLAAVFAQHIFLGQTILTLFAILLGETAYGLLIGYVLGALRKKIQNTMIHIIASFLTPFIAYLPPVMLGGSGILSTTIVGFLIGNVYALHFTGRFRVLSLEIWPTVAFAIESLIFLLVGLDFHHVLLRLQPFNSTIALWIIVISLVVIGGRFIWVYAAAYFVPKAFSTLSRKKIQATPWPFTFLIAWSGMRGGISLAAALAIPPLSLMIDGLNARDIIIFIVFSIILVTLVLQGFLLPWLIRKLGVLNCGEIEKYKEHLTELNARLQMAKAALQWLQHYQSSKHKNRIIDDEINIQIYRYEMIINQLQERIKKHDGHLVEHDEKAESKKESRLLNHIIKAERDELLKLWQQQKINLALRNKLLLRLDHLHQHLN